MLTVQPGSRQRQEPLQQCSPNRYTTFQVTRTVTNGEASSCKLYERYHNYNTVYPLNVSELPSEYCFLCMDTKEIKFC